MVVDLGTRLVREDVISRDDLARALAHASRLHRPLPYALVALELLTEDALVRFFRARMPFGEAQRATLELVLPDVAGEIPRAMSEELGVIAIGRAGETLSVAMVDPSNGHAIDEVAFYTGCTIVPLVGRPSDLDWARDRLYPMIPETAPLSVPLSVSQIDDDAVVELVTRRDRNPQDAPPRRGLNDGAVPAVTGIVELARPKVPTADDWSVAERLERDTPVADGWDLPVAEDSPTTTVVRTVTVAAPTPAPAPAPANAAPPNLAAELAPMITGVHEIPASRRAAAPHGASPATAAPSIPPDATLGSIMARLHRSTDRDEVMSLAAAGAAAVCRRAAVFVVKKGVAQGWEARGDGVASGAIRNVWIPVASPSVLQRATASLEPYVGPVEDTIANGILMGALGKRVDRVGVWPVVVRERAIAILYADGFGTDAFGPIGEVVHELAQALERIILQEKTRR